MFRLVNGFFLIFIFVACHLFVFPMFLAASDKVTLNQIPSSLTASRSIVESIVEGFQQVCDDMYKGLDSSFDKTKKNTVELYPQDFYDIQINSAGKMATVIFAGFYCPGFGGHPFGGSGGSPTFIIVDGKTFKTDLARGVFSVTESDLTFINIFLHGMNCKNSDNGESMPGYKGCVNVTIWDDELKTFYGHNNILKLVGTN